MTKAKLLKKIVAARSAAGLTITEAARRTVKTNGRVGASAKITQPTWWRIESGPAPVRTTWDTLFAMAEAVGVSVSVSVD